MCFRVWAAQHHSSGAWCLSNTHPGLAEAEAVSMVLQVLLLLGLLELVPQPLYPVVVTWGHLSAGKERSRVSFVLNPEDFPTTQK